MVPTHCQGRGVVFKQGYDYNHLVLCMCIADVINCNWLPLNAANEHREVKRVLGTLMTIWKAFHYSPKKAEKLAEIQAELNAPELKMLKLVTHAGFLEKGVYVLFDEAFQHW